MLLNLTVQAERIVGLAIQEARDLGRDSLDAEQLLSALLKEEIEGRLDVFERLTRASAKGVYERLESKRLNSGKITVGKLPESQDLAEVMGFALRAANSMSRPLVSTELLLLGLVASGGEVAGKLLHEDYGIEVMEVRDKIIDAFRVDENKQTEMVRTIAVCCSEIAAIRLRHE